MKRFLSRVVHPLLVIVTIPLLLLVCVAAIVLLVGCDDGGTKPLPCTTGFVLPDGFPNTIDHFGPLQYRDCDYTAEQMRSLRDTMKNTAFEVTSCLDAVYGYDFTTQNPQKGIPIPYFSKILVVNRQLDPPHTHIKFTPASPFGEWFVGYERLGRRGPYHVSGLHA